MNFSLLFLLVGAISTLQAGELAQRTVSCDYLENKKEADNIGHFHGPALITIPGQTAAIICVAHVKCQFLYKNAPAESLFTLVACPASSSICPKATDCFYSRMKLLNEPTVNDLGEFQQQPGWMLLERTGIVESFDTERAWICNAPGQCLGYPKKRVLNPELLRPGEKATVRLSYKELKQVEERDQLRKR